uniref:LOB domain-containing protein n=2 Tax=Brassica campestris TaxID=3711 RepID=M4DYZ0_BRACM
MGGLGSPCGACKFLRRKCIEGCVFAPYFCYEEGSSNFAAIHKVFGASNFSKLISHLPDQDRCDAVRTISYEAQSRLHDPIYGCVSQIFSLQQQVVSLQAQVVLLREEASRKFPQGDCSEQGEFLAQDTPQDLHSWFHQVVSDSNLNQMSDVASTSIDHDESLCRDNKVVMKKQVVFGVILLALFLIFINAKQVEATRLLRTTVDSEIRSVFQSLQKGTVPESGRNRCTHIPKGSGKCHG